MRENFSVPVRLRQDHDNRKIEVISDGEGIRPNDFMRAIQDAHEKRKNHIDACVSAHDCAALRRLSECLRIYLRFQGAFLIKGIAHVEKLVSLGGGSRRTLGYRRGPHVSTT